MNDSRVAAIIRGWGDLYTRGMPAEVRAARRDELEDDLWCEHEEAVAVGRPRRSLDADLLLRLVFGMPSDISWRLWYRGPRTTADLERTSAIDTRTLGSLAIAAAMIWGILFVLFIAFGHAVWTGGFGLLGVVGSLVAAIAFSTVALGLAWRFQDQVGVLGATGAALVVLGAAVSLAGSIAIFAIGSVMLMWDLARIGVLSRTVALTHVCAAIVVVLLVFAQPFDADEAATRALMVGPLAPYVLTWIAIGALLHGRARPINVANG